MAELVPNLEQGQVIILDESMAEQLNNGSIFLTEQNGQMVLQNENGQIFTLEYANQPTVTDESTTTENQQIENSG